MTAEAPIGASTVGAGHPCYVVAELSGNHNGDLGRAKAIIEAAASAGADAVKLQTYTADSLTIDSDRPPFIVSGGTPWDGRRLYDLYREAATPLQWTAPLFEHGRSLGLDVFSTPFDARSVEVLEELDPPAHKVASFELVDHGLLRLVAATRRTVVLSTGMATESEIGDALGVLRAAGCPGVILLRCTSAYPAALSEMDLRTISHMADRWDTPVGLSDHTIGSTASLVAVALGASMIEKHLTLSRGDPGPDSAFSLEPRELADLVTSVRDVESALGTVRYGPSAGEKPSRIFRRSLFIVRDVEAGQVLTYDDVRSIRPGDGIAPRFLEDVIGRRSTCSVPAGTPLSWDHVADR